MRKSKGNGKKNTNKNKQNKKINTQNKKMENGAQVNMMDNKSSDEPENFSVLNPEVKRGQRIGLIIAGVISIIIGALLYRANIHIYDFGGAMWPSSFNDIELAKIPLVLEAQSMILAGLVFWLLIFKYEDIKRITHITLVIILGACIIHAPSLRALLVLIVFLAVVAIMLCFVTEISTALSFFICLAFSIGIIAFIGSNFQLGTYADKVIYIIFSCSMLAFILVGRKISQFWIAAFGSKNTAEAYDQEHFKNHIFMLYLIAFVIINVIPLESKDWNLINNSFLTGIAIIQVDWTKIGPRKKTETVTATEEEKQEEKVGIGQPTEDCKK